MKRIRASLNGGDAREVSHCALVIVVVMIAVYPPSALADADPASDILLAQNAFYPYQSPVPHALEAVMETVLRAAARAGLPLKVAVIGSRENLGAVPEFFGHPTAVRAVPGQRDLLHNNRPPLLVVMPAGFGVVAAGPPNALAGLKVDAQHSSYGLVRSAILAVVSLVRATGRTIATPSIPSNSSAGGSPGTLFAIPVALLVLVGFAILRRRGSRRQEEPDASTEGS